MTLADIYRTPVQRIYIDLYTVVPTGYITSYMCWRKVLSTVYKSDAFQSIGTHRVSPADAIGALHHHVWSTPCILLKLAYVLYNTMPSPTTAQTSHPIAPAAAGALFYFSCTKPPSFRLEQYLESILDNKESPQEDEHSKDGRAFEYRKKMETESQLESEEAEAERAYG